MSRASVMRRSVRQLKRSGESVFSTKYDAYFERECLSGQRPREGPRQLSGRRAFVLRQPSRLASEPHPPGFLPPHQQHLSAATMVVQLLDPRSPDAKGALSARQSEVSDGFELISTWTVRLPFMPCRDRATQPFQVPPPSAIVVAQF